MAVITIRFEVSQHFLDRPAQRDGFVVLAAFLLSFLFIRTSARLMRSPKVPWWPGSVTTGGGLHIHHLVWGIVLVLLSGFLRFSLDPKSPWVEILAAAFGIGMGFTLDEFALWVRLEDVYWSSEGRSSLDAVIVATVIGALVLLGIGPFDESDTSPGLSLLLVIGIDVLLCVIAILKGRGAARSRRRVHSAVLLLRVNSSRCANVRVGAALVRAGGAQTQALDGAVCQGPSSSPAVHGSHRRPTERPRSPPPQSNPPRWRSTRRGRVPAMPIKDGS